MSDDLVQFLRARLDEDAALAAEATQETTGRWTARETDWGGGTVVEDDCGALILPTGHSATQYPHIAHHSPARVLAEVEAKRRTLGRHHDFQGWCAGCGNDLTYRTNDCPELRALASVYAEHPDYRDEWRP